MEYVVGSVAALVSGNVTPSRPKHLKRALTPTKHQPSPNVTPKSEVADRSIFLSPTLQKKKAIIKKSPKRIFENPDLDVTEDSSVISPKADKVKKHLKIELDANTSTNSSLLSPESPKDNIEMLNKTPKKNKKPNVNNIVAENENTPTKNRKRKQNDDIENVVKSVETPNTNVSPNKKKKHGKPLSQNSDNVSPKKIAKRSLSISEPVEEVKTPKKGNNKKKGEAPSTDHAKSPKKQNNKSKPQEESTVNDVSKSPKKKKNKGKKNKNQSKPVVVPKAAEQDKIEPNEESEDDENEDFVNPNAITTQDTDSEHDSDDEVESENDEANKKALEPEESSDEEEKEETEVKKVKPEEKAKPMTDDEIKRTIFVGNVPFSAKCKKEIKKIFSEFGTIETVRIRTVPVKDASVTPKMAVIKSDLHPDRNTVNVYVKFANAASAEKALTANNTVLNENHLRVTKSDTTGAPHDPKCSVFVGNIPFALEDETLRAKFEKCGEIESVRIIRDRKTNAGKGFGYVNFASKDGVELALALSEEDLTIKNRILRVKRCTQTDQKNKRPPPKGLVVKPGGNRFGQKNENTGASRRIAKRQKEEKAGGPANKRPRINQPKEKKPRKEFVGMTAEKKKKNKFDKGQKKKKVISEIMTKK